MFTSANLLLDTRADLRTFVVVAVAFGLLVAFDSTAFTLRLFSDMDEAHEPSSSPFCVSAVVVVVVVNDDDVVDTCV